MYLIGGEHPHKLDAQRLLEALAAGEERLLTDARDAIHAAVMAEHGIDRIMTFDRGFDAYPGIERVA